MIHRNLHFFEKSQTFIENLPLIMNGAAVRCSRLSLGFRGQILFLCSILQVSC